MQFQYTLSSEVRLNDSNSAINGTIEFILETTITCWNG